MVLFVGAHASAQIMGLGGYGTKSLDISFSPLGYTHYSISADKYYYKSYMNVNLGYESNLQGMSTLTELTYSKAKFDKSELSPTSVFDPNLKEDITNISLSMLMGKIINEKSRFQIPIYYGPKFDYVKGGPFHNLTINFCVKARLKFYFSDRFAIFVGGTGAYGWGNKRPIEGLEGKEGHSISAINAAADAGISINLGN